jgi:hypothetical protein
MELKMSSYFVEIFSRSGEWTNVLANGTWKCRVERERERVQKICGSIWDLSGCKALTALNHG